MYNGYGGFQGGGGANNGPYALVIKIADGICLAAVALVLSWSVTSLPADTWAKVWAIGAAIFADGALALTLWSVFSTMANWLSTALHVCLFANCVLWSLNFETAAETCSTTTISWACSGAMRYVFYVFLVASGILQFLYWHIVFDPHASTAGSGQMPCCGPRRQNNMGGGGGYGGGQGGYGGAQGGGYGGDPNSASDESSPATASNIPHLPPGGHRPRVVPTGNLDPSAIDPENGGAKSADASTQAAPHKNPAEREEVVMVQPEGESKPAGDSEHHTSMHVPHGSKEQEEEEERLKCLMAK
ncbi:hypothetical protein JCM10908_007225 [Rhodotorula pacifica]|uniref:uncharacterized protein n=1 Tax=Rhodotorula pacifica TaxID=1495444 RepID=UPI003178D7B7